jgi:choline dehydrogenase-like flavoprotein
MGRAPSPSVVDGDHEVHDVRGLYVCDAGVFPSCLGVNPQVTILALAAKCGDILVSRLT